MRKRGRPPNQAPPELPLAERVEREVIMTLNKNEELMNLPEVTHCETVIEALEMIICCKRCRLDELTNAIGDPED